MKQCKQCGQCCRQGGPALHQQDQELLGTAIGLEQLITIRQDEPALPPLANKVEPAPHEFIKIAGGPGSWQCLFLTEQNQCNLHPAKPLECRLLQCWQPEDLLAMVGKDLLNRKDILANNGPLLELIDNQEQQLPWQEINPYLLAGQQPDHHLVQLVNNDILFRDKAINQHRFDLALEMLYLGRPFFTAFQAAGWRVWQHGNSLQLAKG